MPKNKYINTSVALNNWEIIEKYAKAKLPADMEKYAKLVNRSNAEIKKYDDILRGIKEEENKELYLKNKAKKEKAVKEREQLDKTYEECSKDYNKNLYRITVFKNNFNELQKKKNVTYIDLLKLQNVVNFITDGLFGNKVDEVNGDYDLGADVQYLIKKMVERETVKLNNISVDGYKVNDADISLEEVMEYEKIKGITDKTNGESRCGSLYEELKELEIRIEKTDDNMHINSREFKAMKRALKDTLEVFTKNNGNVNVVDIGDKLEILQRASVNYIKEKGIGGQYTDLGKTRLKLAVDIANCTYNYYHFFPSRDALERNFVSDYMDMKKESIIKAKQNNDADELRRAEDMSYLEEQRDSYLAAKDNENYTVSLQELDENAVENVQDEMEIDDI